MATTEGQTYCLRWNNHKANLVEILDALIKMESYVDCTIVVDDQVQFKAHRVVLAANSPYFQSILQDIPMDHCSILFPGVQAFEMRALLEYMYTGEVNVTQSQIPKIMKIAEQLEVKGLFDMADFKEKFRKIDDNISGRFTPPSIYQQIKDNNDTHTTSTTITNSVTAIAQSSCTSPTYNYKSSYLNICSKSPGPSTVNERHTNQWQLTNQLQSSIPTSAVAMLSSVYESAPDMNPLKRKKISSISNMLMSRDTPILRNVLAQSHNQESTQPMPLVCQNIKQERIEKQSPGSCNGNDFNSDKKIKFEDPHSPYTDKSFEDDINDCPSNYGNDSRLASYVPQQQQKPEWKRYKQYTRSDILSAIECVRNGMSALQASRKYGVPSRTLYDKVKKLGITTGRPMNRTLKRSPSNGSSQANFAFNLSSNNHHYGSNEHHQIIENNERNDRERNEQHHLQQSIPHPAAALLDPTFLQQAFESRGGDIAGREALHAMALAAAAHAAVNGISTSPGTNGMARTPSPQNVIMKYSRSQSPHINHDIDDDEDRVEDLSVGRKELKSPNNHQKLNINTSYQQLHNQQTQQSQQQQQPGVIVPPMTKVSPNNSNEEYGIELKREIITTDDSRD